MKLNLCNDVKCAYINLDSDTSKNEQMVELLDRLGISNRDRLSAVTGIEPHEGVRAGEEHYRNCAESHFSILEKGELPVMILEDDVESDRFESEIEVPDDADALYVGTSYGDHMYTTEEVDGYPHLWKIEKVFATHAIVYLTERYAKQVVVQGKKSIYEGNTPFDVTLAYRVQPAFNVYALKEPFFYQADSKNMKNKWEHLTRQPLRYQRKKSPIMTIDSRAWKIT
jgi:hypothetical protein